MRAVATEADDECLVGTNEYLRLKGRGQTFQLDPTDPTLPSLEYDGL